MCESLLQVVDGSRGVARPVRCLRGGHEPLGARYVVGCDAGGEFERPGGGRDRTPAGRSPTSARELRCRLFVRRRKGERAVPSTGVRPLGRLRQGSVRGAALGAERAIGDRCACELVHEHDASVGSLDERGGQRRLERLLAPAELRERATGDRRRFSAAKSNDDECLARLRRQRRDASKERLLGGAAHCKHRGVARLPRAERSSGLSGSRAARAGSQLLHRPRSSKTQSTSMPRSSSTSPYTPSGLECRCSSASARTGAEAYYLNPAPAPVLDRASRGEG